MRNPRAEVIEISALTGEGVDKFAEWLINQVRQQREGKINA